MKGYVKVLLALMGLAAYASPASAQLVLTGVTVDTAPVFALATIIVTAIAGIWGIKKVIKLGNRS